MYKWKALRVWGIALAVLILPQVPALAQCGTASWYHEGARTANGERYRPDGISAAHRSLPFGTRVKVTHKRTGQSVVVRINDRGPFIRERIIDLSRGAKRVIGMGGLAPVCLTVLGRRERHVSLEGKRKRSANVAGKRRAAVAELGKVRTGSKKGLVRTVRSKQAPVAERRRLAAHGSQYISRQASGSFKLANWPGTTDNAL